MPDQDPLDALAAMGNQQQPAQSAPQPQAAQPAPSDDPLDALANMKAQPQAQAPQPGLLSRAAGAVEDFGAGVAKGAGQTVNTVSKALNAIPVVGETLAPSQGVQAATQMETPTNTAQKLGVGAETIGEFVLGDQALKAASLGEKLLQASKIAKEYESATPFGKAVIEHVMNMARAGAVTSGEAVAKGAGPKQAAEEGAAGAVGQLAGEGVVAGANKVADVAGKLWDTATGKAVQSTLKGGVRNVVNDVANDAGVKMPTGSLRTSVEQVADGVQSKAKGLFNQIDQATGGDFTNIDNKIKNVQFKLRDIAGTDDTLEEKLENQLSGLRAKLDDSIEAAKQNGVDPKVADQAKAAWRQMSALRDVDAQIKASTFGNAKNAPETVDPSKLVGRLQKLQDSGRLVEAMGEDKANALLQAAYDGYKAAANHARNMKIAIGTPLGLGILDEGRRLINAVKGGR
jgi:hypothetical protein